MAGKKGMGKKQSAIDLKTLRTICETLADGMGYTLFDVAADREPTGLYLRVTLQKDGGITLDDCEKYHRALIPLAEKIDYDFLEVCSPGLDRPLVLEQDIRDNIGNTVEAKLYQAMDGRKTITGKLVSMDGEQVSVETESGIVVCPRKMVSQVRLKPDLKELEDENRIDDMIDE